ncbi:hypothetical protein SESBI_21822 [Sesbania bispinosa]|nr:hypothetical protein SESBI_21822 [Sesbania bispinosa]
MILQFLDDTRMEMEKRPSSDIRIKSRKATLSDCHYFLQPGVDICVLSNFECNDDDDSDHCFTHPVWLDAKINSIKRKPHGSGCSCEYYVNIYSTQDSLGVSQRTLSKDVIVVGIDQICVLQILERNCNEDQSYRWNLAEDCSAISETKLLKGKFFFDISWLADTSVIKQVSFYARSVNNKIIYKKLGNNDSPSIRPGSFINVLNLTSDNKNILNYCVSRIEVSATMRITLDPHDSSKDHELSACYDVGSSKCGSKKPERYLGFEDYDDSKEEVGLFTLPSEESEQKHCLTQNVVDDSEVEVSLLPSILYEKHSELNSKQSIVVLALPAYNINRPWPFQKWKEHKRKRYKKPVVVLALPSSADMFSNLKNKRRSMVAKRARPEPGSVRGGRIRFWKMWVLKIGGEGETLVKEL